MNPRVATTSSCASAPELRRNHEAALTRALLSLQGLSVGDALGEFCARSGVTDLAALESAGSHPWSWTDDTEMALCLVQHLHMHREVRQDDLARLFAHRHNADRGYSATTSSLLRQVAAGADWRHLSSALFDGQGSLGNGAAMRVAPLGAYFADTPEQVLAQAHRSAMVTHAHPQAILGAQAVAMAAAYASTSPRQPISGVVLLQAVTDALPAGELCMALRRAQDLLDAEPEVAAQVLGCGHRCSAPDTVPLALWAVARHYADYRATLATLLPLGGDCDTLCAIAGGIAILAEPAAAVPSAWLASREPLPIGFLEEPT